MSIKEITELYGINDFSIEEITHNQDNIPEEYHDNIIPTLCILQKIRNSIRQPIQICSTYRNPEYNKKAGGAKRSLHLVFNAIDFYPLGFNSFSLNKLFSQIADGKFDCEINFKGKAVGVSHKVMGLGLYKRFIHIDTRGILGRRAPAKWNG
ncbi:MAG: D-Ala-D-Ala carboxypeptidase family metallohydrolase [Bacillota bacterium]